MTCVVLTLEYHGQLMYLYSSLLSLASSFLRSLVLWLLSHPLTKRLAQIPGSPGSKVKPNHTMEPQRTLATLTPKTYELISCARDLSSNTIVGVCPVQLHDRQAQGRDFLRQHPRLPSWQQVQI